MANLSANSLFHFTPRSFLLDKFENGFIPRYNTEFDPVLDLGYFNASYHITKMNFADNTSEDLSHNYHHSIQIAMVCFCDIPLSSLEYHMNVYSGYGIGMTKDWGLLKGLNPVLYINDNSDFFRTFSGLLNGLGFLSTLVLENLEKISNELEISPQPPSLLTSGIFLGTVHQQQFLWNSIQENFIKQLKPYKCRGKYKGEIENYSYYNEKEWRYVPWIEPGNKVRPVIMKSLSQEEIHPLNEQMKSHALKFEAKDIKYVIVEHSEDIDYLAEGLKDIQNRTSLYSDTDINSIMTKVITRSQIMEDF